MGKHEGELNRIAGAGEWDVPHIVGLNVALTTFRRSLTTLAESDSWKGAAADSAGARLTQLSTDMGKIQDALETISKTIDAANASRSRATGAAAELPSADVPQFWENAVKGASVVVHPVLGPLAADSAIDAIEGWLGGQREDAAKAALETMQAETSAYAARIDQQTAVIAANTPTDSKDWNLPEPTPEPAPTPVVPGGWNTPTTGRPPGYTGPSVDGSLDPTYPSIPGGGTDPVRPGVPSIPGTPGNPTIPGGPGTPGLPGGPGGTFPGGPGGVVPGGPGGTGGLPGHVPGGGGLLGGIGGGAAGAAALAAGAKAVGAGGAGMRLGGLGAGGVGGPGGAGGAGGAGARGASGASGLLGRAGGLEGGGAGGGAAGANGTGGSGAGGRGTTGMMGGQGGGQGGSERERRNGLGGPIAPKLEDEEENGPRSRGAGAGGRG
ncbi:WXG100 family type VII secretion target [Agromyces soli]